MKKAWILIGFGLVGCVSTPDGFDATKFHADMRACQAQAETDSAQAATQGQKWIGYVASGYALSSSQKDNPATSAWKNHRTDECLMALGYPSSPALAR